MVDIKFSQFFDRPGVAGKIKAATKKALSKFGAFVRTAARRSIRTRKKSSTPGNPPSSHVGLLKKLIFFGYDNETETVLVGPHLLNGRSTSGAALLEFGGVGQVNGKRATYHRFPFMAPALEGERDKFPGLFANAVK